MATTAPRRTRETRSTKQTPERKAKPTTPKHEQGRIRRFIEGRMKASAAKRDQALAKSEENKVRSSDRLKLDAIDQRRSAAATVAKETISAIVEEEKRYTVRAGSAPEAEPADCLDGRVVDTELGLFAVMNGVSEPRGSAELVNELEGHLVHFWKKESDSITSTADALAVMRRVMNAANEAANIRYNAGKSPDDPRLGAAATIVKTFTHGPNGRRSAVVGHTGDTRLYVRKKDGSMRQVTKDHSTIAAHLNTMSPEAADALREKFANVTDVNTLDDTNYLLRADGKSIPDEGGQKVTERWLYDRANIVTQGFGNENYNPDVFVVDLDEGDQLLLTTAGVHNAVPDSTLSAHVGARIAADDKAKNLVADSKAGLRPGLAGKTHLDRTAVVVELGVDRLAGEVALAKKEYRVWAETGSRAPLPVPVTLAQRDGLISLLTERPDLRSILLAGATQRYAQLMANDIDTYFLWQEATLPEVPVDDSVIGDLRPMQLDVVDRRGIYLSKVEDMIRTVAPDALPAPADVLHESVKYIETTEIAQDAVLLNAVMSVLEQVAGRPSETEVTVATIVGNAAVQELATKLGFKPEIVAELLINQVQAIGEAARQQEKAQRSVGRNLVKAAGYAIAGLGLTASAIATPAAALAGIGVARALDAFWTTRKNEADRKSIEAEMRHQLKEGVLAFKGQADADRTYDKVPDGLRSFVDSFVALLVLAKRDQIDGHRAKFEANQADMTRLIDVAINGDPDAKDQAKVKAEARAAYDRKVQREADSLRDVRLTELEVEMINVEATNVLHAEAACRQYYLDYCNGVIIFDRDESDRLEDDSKNKQALLEKRREEIVRVVAAERALFVIDKTTRLVEAQTRLSANSRKSFWDRHPSLRALLGGGETAQEKVTSIGVFLGLGFIARQSDFGRVAFSGYAGARAGEALARLEQWYNQGAEEKRAKLSEADLQTIDLNSPHIFEQLEDVEPRVAVARRRLVEGDLRAKNPAEYVRTLKLVERYDSLRVTAEARRSLYRIAYHSDEVFEAHTANVKDLEAKRATIRRCALLGAVAGGLVGVELVEFIAQKADALANRQMALGGEADGTPAADTGTAADDTTTVEEPGAQMMDQTAAGMAAGAGSSTETAGPDAADGAVEVGAADSPEGTATTEAVAATNLVEGALLANRSVELPGIGTFTEREWHAAVAHGGEGMWHTLKEQVDVPKILALLKETKIKMPDGEVALYDPEQGSQLGVKTPDSLAVVVDRSVAGHETLRFFNAQTHKEIPADELHRYFYKMGVRAETIAAAPVLPDATGVVTIEPDDMAAPIRSGGTEGASSFAQSLWNDGMTRTEFIDAYLAAHRPPLDDPMATAHEAASLGVTERFGSGWLGGRFSHADAGLLDEANNAYNAIITQVEDGGDDEAMLAATSVRAEELAPRPVAGRPIDTAGRGAGGSMEAATDRAGGPRLPEPRAVTVDGSTTLEPAEKAALDFTKRNYGDDDFAIFNYNARTLLTEVGGRNPSFTSDNNLVFMNKGAGVYVDVPNTGRPPVLLTEQLYQTIQHHFDTVLKAQSRTVFSASDWEQIIRTHKDTQRGAGAAA